jgi:hypothetical protein
MTSPTLHSSVGRSGRFALIFGRRGRAALPAKRSRQILKPAPRTPSDPEFFQLSYAHFTRTRKKPKTYGRLFGRFFWGAGKSAKNPEPQHLPRLEIPKNRKNTKKSGFFKARPPDFLPNCLKKGSFSLSVRFLGRAHGRLWP